MLRVVALSGGPAVTATVAGRDEGRSTLAEGVGDDGGSDGSDAGDRVDPTAIRVGPADRSAASACEVSGCAAIQAIAGSGEVQLRQAPRSRPVGRQGRAPLNISPAPSAVTPQSAATHAGAQRRGTRSKEPNAGDSLSPSSRSKGEPSHWRASAASPSTKNFCVNVSVGRFAASISAIAAGTVAGRSPTADADPVAASTRARGDSTLIVPAVSTHPGIPSAGATRIAVQRRSLTPGRPPVVPVAASGASFVVSFMTPPPRRPARRRCRRHRRPAGSRACRRRPPPAVRRRRRRR